MQDLASSAPVDKSGRDADMQISINGFGCAVTVESVPASQDSTGGIKIYIPEGVGLLSVAVTRNGRPFDLKEQGVNVKEPKRPAWMDVPLSAYADWTDDALRARHDELHKHVFSGEVRKMPFPVNSAAWKYCWEHMDEILRLWPYPEMTQEEEEEEDRLFCESFSERCDERAAEA